MALTSKQLVGQLQARLVAIDSQIAALQEERALLTGATAGLRRGAKRKAAFKKVRTAAPKAGKKAKPNSHSAQAVAQYGRRLRDALKAKDSAGVQEYTGKLKKAGKLGLAKLKELTSRKPKGKKGKVSVKEAADRLLDTK